MALIGLYSPAKKSGKSEVARILTNEFGFQVIKFAEPLKNMLRSMYRDMGATPEQIEEMIEGKLKELPIPALHNKVSSRDLQNTLGTLWGRKTIYQDVWVDITKSRIRSLNGASVVVDDVRFPNEFAAIKELGGRVVNIIRPGAPAGSMLVDGLLDHYSFDREILNTGTLEELQERARELI